MEVEKLIEELKIYDFKKNSINSFHQKTGISPKTIKKYLVQYDIPHNCKGVKHPGIRDSMGRFCINFSNVQGISKIQENPKINENPRIQERCDIPKKTDLLRNKRTPQERIAFIQKSISQN